MKIYWELSYGTLAPHCMHGDCLILSAVAKSTRGFGGKCDFAIKPEEKA